MPPHITILGIVYDPRRDHALPTAEIREVLPRESAAGLREIEPAPVEPSEVGLRGRMMIKDDNTLCVVVHIQETITRPTEIEHIYITIVHVWRFTPILHRHRFDVTKSSTRDPGGAE